MSGLDVIEPETEPIAGEFANELSSPFIEAASAKEVQSSHEQKTEGGVVIGELVGMTDVGRTPLVLYPGQPSTAAVRARTVVDLHGPHIGHQVVLMFENADSSRPIVMGVLREGEGWPLDQRPGEVEVDLDGERMIVSAKQQLVLRCGKAIISLSRDGAIEIRGVNLVSRAIARNRVLGGSIDLN